MSVQHRIRPTHWQILVCLVLAGWATETAADGPLRMRVETLTVPPSTRPLAFVVVQNTGQDLWEGDILLQAPQSWQLSPAQRTVKLAAGESQRVAFSIEQARNVAANRYPFTISACSGDQRIVHRQETFVASAPYFKVEVDGRPDEWNDAIPIDFSTGDQQTTISTYWNRRRFCVLVAVQEKQLVPFDGVGDRPFDAVQFALSPTGANDESAKEERAGRFEFLLVATGDRGARCFQLASAETRRDETLKTRTLDALICEDAEVAVLRQDGVTYYECSLAFQPMSDHIRPSEGREFYFSVLVHDPDGTGVRDLGRAAGLWPAADDRNDWSRWPGAQWGSAEPLGNKIRWGLCTSKY